MSTHEFEHYLRLLSGLLRLSSTQRELIAGELRDHLDARLSDLTSQGIPREEAIGIALAEFGDAAGLAADFTRIGEQRKRRWIMRVTFGSIAGAAAAVLVAMALWPVPHGDLALPSASAEQKDKPLAKAPAKPAPATSEDERNARTADKLARLTSVHFLDVPLIDCLQQFAEQHGVQFFVDHKSLEDEGITVDTPVTMDLEKVPTDMVLDLMLGQLGLGYTIRSGVVLVATQSALEDMLEIVVYDVRDLLASTAGSDLPGYRGPGTAAGTRGRKPAGRVPSGSSEQHPDKSSSGKTRPAHYSQDMVEAMANLTVCTREVVAKIGKPDLGTVSLAMRDINSSLQRLAGLLQQITNMQRSGFQLIEIITNTVDPDTWDEVGGPGSIRAYQGALVVAQTSIAHRKIRQLLKDLREVVEKERGRRADWPTKVDRLRAAVQPQAVGASAATKDQGPGNDVDADKAGPHGAAPDPFR